MLPRIHFRSWLPLGFTACATILAAWLLNGPASRSGDAVGQVPGPADPLVVLNGAFREAYARARQETIARSGPVILVEGDNLVLLREGKRTEVKVIPDIYHALKAVSHVPLALYVLLAPGSDKEITEARRADLRSYRDKLLAAEKSLDGRGFTDAVRQRQETILAESRRLLDRVLETKKIAPTELLAFTRRQGPLVMANAADAARAQLDSLHQRVGAWKAEMPADEWQRLRVVIMGSALPRRGNLAKQYFMRLLGEPGEGLRIVYAESLFDETKALNLLGTNLIDTDIAVAFFDDRHRMHRDLLADAAEEHIKQMKFEQ
jgi:hypothetical protein